MQEDSRWNHSWVVARNTRLLFVDDEESIRMTLGAVLGQKGYNVTLAATMKEGLEETMVSIAIVPNHSEEEAALIRLRPGYPDWASPGHFEIFLDNPHVVIIGSFGRGGFPIFEFQLSAPLTFHANIILIVLNNGDGS